MPPKISEEPRTRKGMKKRQKRQERELKGNLILQAATKAALDAGESQEEISKALGIDRKTIYNWLREGSLLSAPQSLVDSSKKAMGSVLVAKFMEIADQLTTEKLAKLNGYQLAVALGIVTDKIQKVFGEEVSVSFFEKLSVASDKPIHEQMQDQVMQLQVELLRRRSATRTPVSRTTGSGDTTENLPTSGPTGAEQD